MLEIHKVRSEQDAQDVRTLVFEFVDWLMERYPDDKERISAYFASQDLDRQLRDLLAIFRPPKAECLLARINGQAAGTVMLKPQPVEGICEMNRMFVRPSARGHGVGKALVGGIIEAGRSLGYRRMVLSAGPRHHEAVALYSSFGFLQDSDLPDTGAGDIELRMRLDL
jgi:putative acetyltransferase